VPLVIFDLDNTLVDRDRAFRRWAAEFVADRGLDPAEVEWLVATDGDGFTPRPAFAASVRDRYRLDEPPEALLGLVRERTVELLEPDPRVPAMLDGLRAAGWRVAIATNGYVSQQRAKIVRAGLAAAIDAVAISEEVGAAKRIRGSSRRRPAGAACASPTAAGWSATARPGTSPVGKAPDCARSGSAATAPGIRRPRHRTPLWMRFATR
jgi:putative hydrolase of the HAD superfamily